MEEKVRIIGHIGHGTTIGIAISALRDAGHNVVIIDGEDADALEQIKQAREAKLRAETILIDNMSVALIPNGVYPDTQYVKPHEVKHPITRKSKFNQKKRRK